MRTTIDSAGRLVIPKPLREAAGLHGGIEVELELRDGRIELEAAAAPMRVARRRGRAVIEADADLPRLSPEDVRDVLERVRR